MSARISFAEAIEDPLLFKNAFYGTGEQDDQGFTPAQRAILKAIYGLPLTDEELETWAVLNGEGTFDELGFPTGVRRPFPYSPREFQDITLVIGRRWGKTSLSSFIVAYEALCGGHHEYLGRVKRQKPVFLQVAQDLETAKANLRQHILSFLESSPIGKTELGDIKKTVTADRIKLPKALIVVGAPSIKLRGQSIAVAALDECGYWPKDREAAAPDVEIERAIRPATVQFPFRKVIKTSTPATKEGILWRDFELGTYGFKSDKSKAHRRLMALRGPTAVAGNPTVTRKELEAERAKDVDGFRREYLAEFQDALSGFLNPDLISAAIDKGITIRKPPTDAFPVATIDPGFKRDAFVLSIGHMEGRKFILDLLESWRGTSTSPLSPTVIMQFVAGRCKEYGASLLYSDQYHVESLQDLAEAQGITLCPSPLTAGLKKSMWADFNLLLHQGRLRLLDHHELIEECLKLERHITNAQSIQIYGKRDDHAMAVALNVYHALHMGEPQRLAKPPVDTDPNSSELWAAYRQRIAAGEGSGQGAWDT